MTTTDIASDFRIETLTTRKFDICLSAGLSVTDLISCHLVQERGLPMDVVAGILGTTRADVEASIIEFEVFLEEFESYGEE